MGMKWTEQQEQAISAGGSDILVSAAAGSGKTAVLTERIKQLVIDKGISVDNMLIVTFSNAAASEMKEKIIKALRKALNEEKTNGTPENTARLRAQIVHLSALRTMQTDRPEDSHGHEAIHPVP